MIVEQAFGLFDIRVCDQRFSRRQRRVFDAGFTSDQLLDDLNEA